MLPRRPARTGWPLADIEAQVARATAASAHATPASARATLDHVVVAVRDLEVASATFRGLGFQLKEGRLHANGLRNRHIEFEDGTEVELMAVQGPPGDEIAQGYADFLEGGSEGGAYLALRGEVDSVVAAAARAGIASSPFRAGGFSYVTFPAPGLAALFVVEYPASSGNPTTTGEHENRAEGIATVWIEGTEELEELLLALGWQSAGRRQFADGRTGSSFAVGASEVVVIPSRRPRPRVLGVELVSPRPDAPAWAPTERHGVWLDLRGRGG